jgi:ribonuclease HII
MARRVVCIIIAGGDEAGRGAVIGPLVISLVSISKGKEGKLPRIGVRDSKLLTNKRREFLKDEIYSIAEEVCIYRINNNEINKAMEGRISINELEALNFAKLIDSMEKEPARILLDSPDVVSERFGVRIGFFSKKNLAVKGIRGRARPEGGKKIQVIAEHKADARYPVVSCASIIAKSEREKAMDEIEEEAGMELGSGYPSDRYTIDALRRCLPDNSLKPYIREYWKTLRMIRQTRIDDFIGERS